MSGQNRSLIINLLAVCVLVGVAGIVVYRNSTDDGQVLGLDTVGATASIIFPSQGSQVSGKTYITISTGEELGNVSYLQLYIDNQMVAYYPSPALIQNYLWDTTIVAAGTHSVYAIATYPSGVTSQSPAISISVSNGSSSSDATAPTTPTNLTASAVSCGQIDLSWTHATDLNGSGMRSYHINRVDNLGSKDIAALRNTFTDTLYLKSSTTYNYSIVGEDWAGNQSTVSNIVSVTTPECPTNATQSVVDDIAGTFLKQDRGPLGRVIATYGNWKAIIYQKVNSNLRYDTYLYINDETTGAASKFLLHAYPGYDQVENEYFLASPTELWTFSYQESINGSVKLNKYQLNDSPLPTSATLVYSKSLGDKNSVPKALIRLKSGAFMALWSQEAVSSAYPTTLGIAYRSPNDVWSELYPINPESVSSWPSWSQTAIAQHPTDNSVWVFQKRDGTSYIMALRFFEDSSGIHLDWINDHFIAVNTALGYVQDGNNGPEVEFPSLVATPDPSRNAILLAYQSHKSQFVFVDPLFQGNVGNTNQIFLKQAPINIAKIGVNGTKDFITTGVMTERIREFGFNVDPNGTIHLIFAPIDKQSLTMNKWYHTSYASNTWSSPSLVGFGFGDLDDHSGLGSAPRWLIYHPHKPEVAFLNPDRKIRIFSLDDTSTTGDSAPPSIPTNVVTIPVSASVINVSWNASTDNVGVTSYDVYRNSNVIASTANTNYSDTNLSSATTYTYQVTAKDLAGNISQVSSVVSTTTLSQSPGSANQIQIGSTVETTNKVKVRLKPSTKGQVICTQLTKARGIVVGGPTVANGYTWWQVDYNSLCDGWSAANYLKVIP